MLYVIRRHDQEPFQKPFTIESDLYFLPGSSREDSELEFSSQSIQQAIARHEPRLQQVSVKLELNEQSTSALNFAIRAVLIVHPAEEPVSFDAMLLPSTLQYSVTRSRAKL